MLKTSSFRLGSTNLITSGTLATGTFQPNVNDPLSSIKFGRPFYRKIKKVVIANNRESNKYVLFFIWFGESLFNSRQIYD